MKLSLLAILTATTMATAAAAGDFDNAQLSVVAESGALAFKLEGNQSNGYTNMEVRAEVLSYSLGKNVDSTLDVFVGHNRVLDQMTAGAEYAVVYAPNAFSVYGSAELAYTAQTNNLSSGDVFVTPTAGVSYVFAEKLTAFGEVSYSWNASNSWTTQGGALEVGMDYAITPKWSLVPSLVRTFDTGADSTQLHIETRFAF
jgi:hypothetical protein